MTKKIDRKRRNFEKVTENLEMSKKRPKHENVEKWMKCQKIDEMPKN